MAYKNDKRVKYDYCSKKFNIHFDYYDAVTEKRIYYNNALLTNQNDQKKLKSFTPSCRNVKRLLELTCDECSYGLCKYYAFSWRYISMAIKIQRFVRKRISTHYVLVIQFIRDYLKTIRNIRQVMRELMVIKIQKCWRHTRHPMGKVQYSRRNVQYDYVLKNNSMCTKIHWKNLDFYRKPKLIKKLQKVKDDKWKNERKNKRENELNLLKDEDNEKMLSLENEINKLRSNYDRLTEE